MKTKTKSTKTDSKSKLKCYPLIISHRIVKLDFLNSTYRLKCFYNNNKFTLLHMKNMYLYGSTPDNFYEELRLLSILEHKKTQLISLLNLKYFKKMLMNKNDDYDKKLSNLHEYPVFLYDYNNRNSQFALYFLEKIYKNNDSKPNLNITFLFKPNIPKKYHDYIVQYFSSAAVKTIINDYIFYNSYQYMKHTITLNIIESLINVTMNLSNTKQSKLKKYLKKPILIYMNIISDTISDMDDKLYLKSQNVHTVLVVQKKLYEYDKLKSIKSIINLYLDTIKTVIPKIKKSKDYKYFLKREYPCLGQELQLNQFKIDSHPYYSKKIMNNINILRKKLKIPLLK